MNAFSVLMCILLLLVVPVCAGYAVCGFCRIPRGIAACFLGGTFMGWALLQCVSVPMTLLRLGFTPLVWVALAGMGILCLFGLAVFIRDQRARAGRASRRDGMPWRAEDVVALLALVAGYLYLAYKCARYQHVDVDDARLVVTAVDIENTNRLFLTDYGTGTATATFLATMRHDLFSPWAVYMALVARLTALPVAVVAHSVLPQSLMLCALSAWLALAGRFFRDRRFEKYGATLLVLLFTLFSRNTGYTAESFFLRRLWQGKAVVSSIGIPTLYLALTSRELSPRGWRCYLPVYVTAFAMCFMSAMGIIMCTMMCGAFGLGYGIQRRSMPVALKTWGGAVICVFYVGVMLVLMT